MPQHSALANFVIVEEPHSWRIVDANTLAEREVTNWRLTMHVGGVPFHLATTTAKDAFEAAELFAARMRVALAPDAP